jgi:hypothetical protein
MAIEAYPTTYTVLDFLRWQKDGTLQLRPPFQRQSVWRAVLKSSLTGVSLGPRYAICRFSTEFEWFLEELFFAILTGAARVDASCPKLLVRDPQLARAVARGDDRYLIWLPIDDTVGRANRLLVDGQPFVRLATRGSIKADLKRALAVRNATAHKSLDAQTKFQAATSNVFATAGDYLASRAGGQTAREAILADLHRYGQALVGTTAASMKLLGPEDPLRSNTRPGGGTYVCQSCGSSYVLANASVSLRCPRCDPPCHACGHRTGSAVFRRS